MKRHPDRDQYEAELAVLNSIGPVPEDYIAVVHHRRPDLKKSYISDVRLGRRADLAVVAEIRRVQSERMAALIRYPQVLQS